MSTTLLPSRELQEVEVPLLYCGDHLSQPEFHRRYEAYPKPNVRFELIGGVVYMMTPAGFDHGRGDYKLGGISFQYEVATLGVLGAANATVILNDTSEPQPDLLMMLMPECGGKSQVRGQKTRYIVGPPELVIEVAHSSVALDLNRKHADYLLAGIQEYIVFDVAADAVHWFDLRQNRELSLPEDRILRSFMFPGYWLDTQALLERDVRRLADCMARGIASDEHRTFVSELAVRRDQFVPQKRQPAKTIKRPKRKKDSQ